MVTSGTLALLAAIGWLVYVAVYTPLKSRSTWQTPVGARPGPRRCCWGRRPWADCSALGHCVLFGIVFFWQFPHSMAVAWRYRREFAAAGVKVAAATDPTGRSAGIWAVLGAAALLPISLLPLLLVSAGGIYGVAAGLLGTAYLGLAACFARRPDDSNRPPLAPGLVRLPARDVRRALADAALTK